MKNFFSFLSNAPSHQPATTPRVVKRGSSPNRNLRVASDPLTQLAQIHNTCVIYNGEVYAPTGNTFAKIAVNKNNTSRYLYRNCSVTDAIVNWCEKKTLTSQRTLQFMKKFDFIRKVVESYVEDITTPNLLDANSAELVAKQKVPFLQEGIFYIDETGITEYDDEFTSQLKNPRDSIYIRRKYWKKKTHQPSHLEKVLLEKHKEASEQILKYSLISPNTVSRKETLTNGFPRLCYYAEGFNRTDLDGHIVFPCESKLRFAVQLPRSYKVRTTSGTYLFDPVTIETPISVFADDTFAMNHYPYTKSGYEHLFSYSSGKICFHEETRFSEIGLLEHRRYPMTTQNAIRLAQVLKEGPKNFLYGYKNDDVPFATPKNRLTHKRTI